MAAGSDTIRERWQDSVNAADLLLMLAAADDLGLCQGLDIDRVQCEFVLRRGQDLGFIPDSLEKRFFNLERRRPLRALTSRPLPRPAV